jgi:DNA-directed RNA polymerase subunit E'
MFYKYVIEDYIKLEPKFLKGNIKQHLKEEIAKIYEGKIDNNLGIFISLLDINKIDNGVFIPEDGYVYFKTEFEMLAYKPEINELTYGIVANTSNIGAFVNIGVIDGLTHITQVGMEGFEFSNNQLVSKDGKVVIKTGDKVKARIIAVSYKEKVPKVGLTMRQPGLGKIE